MRLRTDRSNDLAPLSAFRSWLDCTINTSGCNFRKGHHIDRQDGKDDPASNRNGTAGDVEEPHEEASKGE